mmetsp:Transcript_15671/g.23975  ORF Transcript_15671/g.23975 Transcript_15671/m.23975 type:complete len:320 (-) Transcript_15671:1469-2428(-)
MLFIHCTQLDIAFASKRRFCFGGNLFQCIRFIDAGIFAHLGNHIPVLTIEMIHSHKLHHLSNTFILSLNQWLHGKMFQKRHIFHGQRITRHITVIDIAAAIHVDRQLTKIALILVAIRDFTQHAWKTNTATDAATFRDPLTRLVSRQNRHMLQCVVLLIFFDTRQHQVRVTDRLRCIGDTLQVGQRPSTAARVLRPRACTISAAIATTTTAVFTQIQVMFLHKEWHHFVVDKETFNALQQRSGAMKQFRRHIPDTHGHIFGGMLHALLDCLIRQMFRRLIIAPKLQQVQHLTHIAIGAIRQFLNARQVHRKSFHLCDTR